MSAVAGERKVVLRRGQIWLNATWWSNMISSSKQDIHRRYSAASIWKARAGGSAGYDQIGSASFVWSGPLSTVGSVDILSVTIVRRCSGPHRQVLNISSLSFSASVVSTGGH